MQNFNCRFMNKIGYVISVKFMGVMIKWIFYFYFIKYICVYVIYVYMTKTFKADLLNKSVRLKSDPHET